MPYFHSLAMWRHLKKVRPEPQPNRITNDEDNYKSSIVKVKPGLLLISEKDEDLFVCQHSSKPNVSCMCFSVNMKEFVNTRKTIFHFAFVSPTEKLQKVTLSKLKFVLL
jgi:hypothetical protein